MYSKREIIALNIANMLHDGDFVNPGSGDAYPGRALYPRETLPYGCTGKMAVWGRTPPSPEPRRRCSAGKRSTEARTVTGKPDTEI